MKKITALLGLVLSALALTVDAGNFSINRGNIATNRMQARTGPQLQPSFVLNFRDLGSGAVDTTADRGGASATFTRATTATTIGSTGLVVGVASGTARSYYDPTSLAYLGYLAEGARTNLCLQSEDFSNASWVKAQATVSANAVASPDGNVTADKLAEDNTNNTHQAGQVFTYVAVPNTATVFAKAAERSVVWMVAFDGTNSFGKFFDLAGGTVGNTIGTAPTSASITQYANGWYRLQITFTPAAAAGNLTVGLASANGTSSYLGVTGNGAYFWGAQLEGATSTFASSYMPTTVASFTRNADLLTYPVIAGFDTAGTMFAQWMAFGSSGSNRVVGDGAAGNPAPIFTSNANTAAVFDGTGIVSTGSLGTVPVAIKGATAWSGSTMSACGNGSVVAGGAYDGAFSLASIGIGTGGGQPLFGTISSTRYFPRRLPDGLDQNLTR